MKNIFLLVSLTVLITALCSWFLPWYAFTIPLLGLFYVIPSRPVSSFLIGFVSVFLLYAGIAWYLDQSNQGILSQRMGTLFGGLSSTVLILVSGVSGGLLGGFSTLTGSLLFALMKKQKPNNSLTI